MQYLAAPPFSVTLELALLLGLLYVLGACGRRIAGRLLPAQSGATRASFAVLTATALATVPATVLGHFGWLWPVPFFAVVAGLAILVALLTRGETEPRDTKPSLALPASGWARPLAAAAIIALITAGAVAIYQERYAPPGVHGFDDNSYHLATVATWRERGDLAGVKFAHGDRSTPYYPIVGELVSWVLLAPFGDNDAFARWSQLPYFLATLVVLAALGRRLGLSPRVTLLAVLLYGGLKRAFPTLALGAGNDHAATFFTLAGLDAMLLLAASPSPAAGLYLGLALGLLVGTKFLGLLFVPLILAAGAVACALRGRGAWRGQTQPVLRAAGVVILVAGMVGGYTYLRNAVNTGNPLYPVPLHLGSWELPGTPGVTIAERRLLPPFAIELPEFFFGSDRFGPLGRFLWVPAAILAPLLALGLAVRNGRERRQWLSRATVLALPVAFFLIFLYQVHDHRDSRYLFPALGLAALGAAWLLDEARRVHPRWGSLEILCLLTTCALAVTQGTTGKAPLLILTLAIFAAWTLDRPSFADWARHLGRRPALATLPLLLLLPGVVHTVARYPRHRLQRAPVARVLEAQVGAAGAAVAYVGYNYPYPYWGSRLQNRVAIVPRNFQRDARLYLWGGTAADFSSRVGRFEAWWRNLRALDVRYVVVVREGEENPERAWMQARSERFERLFVDGETELWRVRLPAVQSPRRYAKISGATMEASD